VALRTVVFPFLAGILCFPRFIFSIAVVCARSVLDVSHYLRVDTDKWLVSAPLSASALPSNTPAHPGGREGLGDIGFQRCCFSYGLPRYKQLYFRLHCHTHE